MFIELFTNSTNCKKMCCGLCGCDSNLIISNNDDEESLKQFAERIAVVRIIIFMKSDSQN
jgi:hypothetical protein